MNLKTYKKILSPLESAKNAESVLITSFRVKNCPSCCLDWKTLTLNYEDSLGMQKNEVEDKYGIEQNNGERKMKSLLLNETWGTYMVKSWLSQVLIKHLNSCYNQD